MTTKWIVAYVCDTLPCNNRTAVIKVVNMTLPAGDQEKDEYDHNGAMRFIIATVLVYSLIGVFGMLLLRIKRSATRSQRSITVQEETLHEYIRQQDALALEGRRDRLKKETERMTKQLSCTLSRPMSVSSTMSDSTGIGEESSFLYSSGLSSSEDTLNMSPRSTHFSPVKFTSRENLRISLPPLFEGREESKTEPDVSAMVLDKVHIDVHGHIHEYEKPSNRQTNVDLESVGPTQIDYTDDCGLANDHENDNLSRQIDNRPKRTSYDFV